MPHNSHPITTRHGVTNLLSLCWAVRSTYLTVRGETNPVIAYREDCTPQFEELRSSMNTVSKLLPRLQTEIKGEVLNDPVSLGLYATDASMYQIMPLAVVIPRDRADTLRAVRICGELGAPILPRGSG